MKSINFGYIGAIDQIRCIAALWITAYHYYVFAAHYFVLNRIYSSATLASDYWFWTYNPVYSIVAVGHTAVSLFMVLSGFIFTYGVSDRELKYSAFIKNRVLRVYPLWATLVLFGAFTTTSNVELVTLIEAMLPIGLKSSVLPWTPFTAMHWSLVIEFQFYLLFPLLIATANRIGMCKLTISLLCALFIFRLLAIGFGADSYKLAYHTILGRLDQFVLGMLLAHFYSLGYPSRRFAKISLPLLLGLSLLIAMYVTKLGLSTVQGWVQSFRMTLEGMVWALTIACYLRLATCLPKLLATFMEKIGEISFSIYMLHIAVIWIFCTYNPWIRLGFGLNVDLVFNYFVLVLPSIIGAAFISFHAFEKPFLALRVPYLKPRIVPN